MNERVIALRDLKKRIVENITNDTKRLTEISLELEKFSIGTLLSGPGHDLLELGLNAGRVFFSWPKQ